MIPSKTFEFCARHTWGRLRVSMLELRKLIVSFPVRGVFGAPVTAHCPRIDRLKVAHALMIRLHTRLLWYSRFRRFAKMSSVVEASCVCRSSRRSWKRMRKRIKRSARPCFLKSDVLSFSILTSCPRLSRPSII
jgi:hypothetical protein